MSVVLEDPPYTPVEPVTDVWHGLAITDPYRWLEDSHSERTREWIAVLRGRKPAVSTEVPFEPAVATGD